MRRPLNGLSKSGGFLPHAARSGFDQHQRRIGFFARRKAKKMRPDTLIDATPWERVAKSSLVEKLYEKK